MYIGSTDQRGLHHLIYEVVDNAVDEAVAGHASSISITIHPDSSVTVVDDGRGIPTGMHEKMKKSALEVVMTTLHAGGKFGGEGYRMSSGLHGVGVSVVNALSEWCVTEVRQNGGLFRQRYEYGIPVGEVEKVKRIPKRESGTTQRWMPDTGIFDSLEYDYDTLATRLRELAYLTRGLRITLIEESTDREATFYFEGGIQSYVRHLNRTKNVVNPVPFYINREVGDYVIEVALQYNDTYGESTHTFANNVNTIDGGTHLTGFKAALTRTVNDYARRNGLLKENDPNLSGDDVREGLTAIVSVKLPEPQFEGQTKGKLGNADMAGAVQSVVNEYLGLELGEQPQQARKIVEKCINAARAREAARKARELVQREGRARDLLTAGQAGRLFRARPESCRTVHRRG